MKPVVLIVDDEPANRFLLEGLLSANNYEPVVAENGMECLSILETRLPDLILLDIMMPRMTGIEVLKQIMKSKTWKTIPVIMVSAKTASTDIKLALNLGAIDYIKKPFNETELLARVKVGIRLKQNEDNLREMLRLRNDFVRIISHDLRSPFTAIHGFAELLRNSDNLSEKQLKSIDYIIKSVEFSDDYFNKLLSWSMLDHGDIQLSKKTFHIKAVVDSIYMIFNHKALEKKISLQNNLKDEMLITADETFFRQAISNLINNAIKFTNEGGAITCFMEEHPDNRQLIISDNGIGMPEGITNETLLSGNIITSQRGTRGERGTGIGLSICKKILDAHGFGIRFERNGEGGTNFMITMSL